jgi:chemotaxis protein histidine kinase CheA
MAEMSNEGANSAAGIDLSQFFQVFFEEAGENLQAMEQMLLELDIAAADDEELNAIFRCAHSVKGGAATFGFTDVAELTHQMEALLDKLRRHELAPTTQMVDVLLAAGDALKALLFNCVRFGPESQNRESRDNFKAHLLGKIGFVEQINQGRGAKLKALFEKILWKQ